MKATRRYLLTMIVSMVIALTMMPAHAHALTAEEYWNRSLSFVNNDKWKDGANWYSDCTAYARDYTSQVFGYYDWTRGTRFTDASQIRSGDVIHDHFNTNHYFVVIERDGNKLYTAEGNVTGIANRYGDGNNGPRVLVADNHYYLDGNTIRIYDQFFGGGTATFYEGWHFETGGATTINNWDTKAPSYSGFKVSEINSATFTVSAKLTDDNAVGVVQCAVWTNKNGQDDLKWYDMHCTDNNSIYWARIPWSDHNGERGTYTVHLYAYDLAGNKTNPGLEYNFDNVVPDNPPVVTDFKIAELREGAFTILANVKDSSGVGSVRYAIWTEKNGQDDIKWQDGVCTDNNNIYWARVNFSDHNGERGKYIVHIYAYDTGGNLTNKGIEYIFDDKGPTISDVTVSDVSEKGYTVTCTVTDEIGVIRVQFPSWTLANAQDDLPSDWGVNKKCAGTKNGNNYTFRVNTSDHNNELGTYRTHIYAWDTLGNRTAYVVPDVNLSNIGPVSIATATVSAANQTYTGSALTPTPTVKLGSKTLVSGTDYTVTYTSNTNVGTATVTVTGKGNYTGTAKGTFTISAASISSATVSAIADQVYTGKALKPAPTVKIGSTTLKSGTDYTLSYKNNTNVGTATITITGKGNYTGTKTATFRIVEQGELVSIYECDIVLPRDEYTYTGKAIKPKPTVTYGGRTLREGTDYKLSYEDNVEVGTAWVVITGVGTFEDEWYESFEIVEADDPTIRPANVEVYRLYNTKTSEHLWTTSANEYEQLPVITKGDWRQEGVAWMAPDGVGTPVYRLYNRKMGDHYYSMSQGEIRVLTTQHGWNVDNGGAPAFWSATKGDDGAIPLYCVYNSRLKKGQHHFTASAAERDFLVANAGWRYEKEAFYGFRE